MSRVYNLNLFLSNVLGPHDLLEAGAGALWW